MDSPEQIPVSMSTAVPARRTADTPPPLLPYALPDLNGRPPRDDDLSVYITSVAQLFFGGLAVFMQFLLLDNFLARFGSFSLWEICYFLQVPLYTCLSALALAGSRPGWIARRRRYYRIYMITFGAVFGFDVLGTIVNRAGGPIDLQVVATVPACLLLTNPTLVILLLRRLFGVPDSAKTVTTHREAMP
jgi:hypothetical protein